MSISCVVLAAGIGRRYGGLKQMDPVGPGGEFIIDYSVYDALRAGIRSVVFVIRADIEEAFRATIGRRIEPHADVVYAHQELSDVPPGFSVPPGRVKPWGTAHALLAARHATRGPCVVINADDFYGRESYAVLERFLRETANDPRAHAMVGFSLRNTLSERGSVSRAICVVGHDHRLQAVAERTRIEKQDGGARFLDEAGQWRPLSGDEVVSMNMWGFKPSIFPHLEREFRQFLDTEGGNPAAEFFIPTVVSSLISSRAATVSVLTTPEAWVGVTYPEEKAGVQSHIRRLIAAGVYPERLWE